MISYPECIKNDAISEIYSSQIRDMLKHFCEIKQASLHSPKNLPPMKRVRFRKKTFREMRHQIWCACVTRNGHTSAKVSFDGCREDCNKYLDF